MIKKENFKQILILLITGILVFWFINNLTFIGSIIAKIIKVLSPFILGVVLAFILNIPMTKIENSLNKLTKSKNNHNRVISITLSLIIFILIIGFVLFLLIPEIINNIESLISSIPGIVANVENWTLNILDKYPEIQTEVAKIFDTNNINTLIPNILNHIVNGIITFVTSIVTGVFNLFMSIVFSVYILSQKEYLLNGLKKVIKAYLKPHATNRVMEIGKLTNKTFHNFITGQCLEAIILGSIFFVVLSIFRFPYALIISVLTTITALIPIFGALIAMVVGAILIAIESPLQALIFIVVFQIIQQIEGNIIYPKVVGKSVGLSPLWTLLAISVGGSLFGIIGMLTALPLASILYVLLKDSVNLRINEKIEEKKKKA